MHREDIRNQVKDMYMLDNAAIRDFVRFLDFILSHTISTSNHDEINNIKVFQPKS